jgi:CheY-like chemotaxis protein
VSKIRERGNTRTVLVVEDIGEICSKMGEVLVRKGHQVLFAGNAHEAIKAAERQLPALILTDLDLPTFDKLLTLVGKHDQLKHVDVAVIDIDVPVRDINDRKLKRKHVRILRNFDQLDALLG